MTPLRATSGHPVFLEVGHKRVFACAIEWPGWARSGRDEEAALEALFAYAPRYARVLRGTRLGFQVPQDVSALAVVERLRGTATTDFGAPDVSPAADAKPVRDTDLRRFTTLFRACWRAFDRAAEAAENVELTKGPRGGGRDLEKIVDHVLGSDESYLSMIGAKAPKGGPDGRAERVRRAVIDGLDVAVRQGVPPGPRGGKRWTPRYFVRRTVWHSLDHAWEIEDRTPEH
ncbi:MAG TPA: hypothetical protein VFS38_00650 [Actinomycetota bacterium]|nr:hypothetical protein [Actinomycetota bacterium]